MLADNVRFEGFTAPQFRNLLSLFAAHPDEAGDSEAPLLQPRPRGTLVLVTDAEGAVIASLMTGGGAAAATAGAELQRVDDPEQIAAACERAGARRALILEHGAIEELTERAAERVGLALDYVSQWLTLLSVARELEEEGRIRFWPTPKRLPLPSLQMLSRALDLLLPDGHSLLLAIWESETLWTACALHRRHGLLDRIVGPELLLDWTGPLGGDFRRDQRLLRNVVAGALGPLHLGIFAERAQIEGLLRASEPGAWTRAVALRDVIINPSPSYVQMALAADAARAVGRRARNILGGIDLAGTFGPAAKIARERIANVGSITDILGFSPLEGLAERLRRRGDGAPEDQ
ncbi:MAG: hypothetical protein OEZ06_23635 [Myxococcales bacterium]|nr:hypothetical protein [Myxococcales bacterium]